MQADVVGRDIEQLGHLRLRQPDGLAVGAQLDAATTIFAGVEDQPVHGSNHVAVGKLLLV